MWIMPAQDCGNACRTVGILLAMLSFVVADSPSFAQQTVDRGVRRATIRRNGSERRHVRLASQADQSVDEEAEAESSAPEATSPTEPPSPLEHEQASGGEPRRELWDSYGGSCNSCGSHDSCEICSTCSGCDDGFMVCESCPTTVCERMWFRSEMLTWWLSGATTPGLVTQSPNGTPREEAGVIGFPATQILSGGEGFGDEARLGAQLTLGGWIDGSHGLEGYWMYLGEDDSGDYSATSVAGDPILARPFYNARDGFEDAVLIGFPDVAEGTTRVESSSELQSAGLRLRQVISDCGGSRFELLGGYRYLRFKDSITITDNITIRESGGVFQQGSTVDLQDIFAAENHWHGGEIGVATNVCTGRVSLDIAGKLGLGGIRRRRLIRGATIVTSPGGAVAGDNVGLLAAGTNSGSGSQYDFSLIPELNLSLNYRAADNLTLGVGYTLMFVTRVLRSGDMIDRNLNPSQVPIGGSGSLVPAVPVARLDDSTLRAHGLNFLAELKF